MAKRCSKRRRTRRGGIYEGRQGGLEAVPFGRIVHSGGGRKKMARTRRRTRRGGIYDAMYVQNVGSRLRGGGRKKMARTRRRTRRGGFKFTPYDGVNDI